MQPSDRFRCAILVLTVPVAVLLMREAPPRSDRFVTLATGLAAEEAGLVRNLLETKRVPFEFRDGGQTVMVPAGRCAELTVEFAAVSGLRRHVQASSRDLDPKRPPGGAGARPRIEEAPEGRGTAQDHGATGRTRTR